jgi:phosphoglycerate kinase
LDAAIASNVAARKYFGGGDTLQEFKSLSPGLYMTALECPSYYLFTGGGTVLKALELGDATKLPCVELLLAAEGETRSKAPAPKCMALESCDCGPTPA